MVQKMQSIVSQNNFVYLGFWLIASAEIYITTLPDGTQIDGSLSSIPYNDISNLVTHLFGLPSRSESKWKGITLLMFLLRLLDLKCYHYN